jgi:GNAT superfamily N-acetyltransferase
MKSEKTRSANEASAPTITLAVASSDRHFEEILALQRRYHVRTLDPEVQSREGFVFAEHTAPLLRRMAARSPQAIALSRDRVVGYCLSLPVSLKDEVPSLAPMFRHFAKCSWRGKPLSEQSFVVGGQVCVDREYRRQGLLARLYEQLRVSLPAPCDLCVTEISTRNPVSIRAHEKMGFEIISRYADEIEEWVIVAWDLAPPAHVAESSPAPGHSR